MINWKLIDQFKYKSDKLINLKIKCDEQISIRSFPVEQLRSAVLKLAKSRGFPPPDFVKTSPQPSESRDDQERFNKILRFNFEYWNERVENQVFIFSNSGYRPREF
jgi:hypothetical protein